MDNGQWTILIKVSPIVNYQLSMLIIRLLAVIFCCFYNGL